MKYYLKKFSGTVIAVAVLAVLGGYIFFFERADEDTPSSRRERVFSDIKREEVREIELKFPNYAITCRRENDDWFITAGDDKFRADPKAVAEVIDLIAGLEIEKVASENPADISLYGLDAPRLEATLTTASGERVLVVGIESPVTSGVYVKDGGDIRTLIVKATSLERLVGAAADDFRSKRVISLDESRINRIRVTRFQLPTVEIWKIAGDWQAEALTEGLVIDGVQVESFVKTFDNLQVQGFEKQKPLSAYGLDKPSAEIEIFEGEKSVRILFGGRAAGGGYYMKLASGDAVYSVADTVYYEIPRGIEDLCLAKIVRIGASGVLGLEINRADGAISLIREGNDWRVKDNSRMTVSRLRVLGLLDALENLYADEYLTELPKDLSPFGLAEPEIEITIAEKDNKRTTILLGARADGRVFLMIQGRRAIYRAADEIVLLIPKSAEELTR